LAALSRPGWQIHRENPDKAISNPGRLSNPWGQVPPEIALFRGGNSRKTRGNPTTFNSFTIFLSIVVRNSNAIPMDRVSGITMTTMTISETTKISREYPGQNSAARLVKIEIENTCTKVSVNFDGAIGRVAPNLSFKSNSEPWPKATHAVKAAIIMKDNSNLQTVVPTQSSTVTVTPQGRRMIPLGPKTNLPKAGKHQGRFADYQLTEVVDGDDTYSEMELSVELDARDKAGKPFTVTKHYTLRGRGTANLRNDLKDWAGQDIVPTDVSEFDSAVFLGRKVTVGIETTVSGKKGQTVIKSFGPAREEAQVEAQVEPLVPATGPATPQSEDHTQRLAA